MVVSSIGDILKRRTQAVPALKHADASRTVEVANIVLEDFFGADIRRYARAIYAKAGILSVTCLSSIVAQEIKLREQEIVNAVNNRLHEQAVQRIRYLG